MKNTSVLRNRCNLAWQYSGSKARLQKSFRLHASLTRRRGYRHCTAL